MCNFILISVDSSNAQTLNQNMGYHLSRTESNAWIAEYHKDDVSFLLTDGHCSCSLTYVRDNNFVMPEEEIEKLKGKTISKLSKPKYRKRGWTQEKIIKEAEKVALEAKRNVTGKFVSGVSEVLVNNIGDILGLVQRISLYIFSTNGKIVLPKVAVRQELNFKNLKNQPSNIEFNILYDIKN